MYRRHTSGVELNVDGMPIHRTGSVTVSVFFQDLCGFVIHCNKRHIFLSFFFVLFAHY